MSERRKARAGAGSGRLGGIRVPASLRSLAHPRWLDPKTGIPDARAMGQAVTDFAQKHGLMDERWSKCPDYRALKALGIYQPTARDRFNQHGMDKKP